MQQGLQSRHLLFKSIVREQALQLARARLQAGQALLQVTPGDAVVVEQAVEQGMLAEKGQAIGLMQGFDLPLAAV